MAERNSDGSNETKETRPDEKGGKDAYFAPLQDISCSLILAPTVISLVDSARLLVEWVQFKRILPALGLK